jgi:hypothetical protein
MKVIPLEFTNAISFTLPTGYMNTMPFKERTDKYYLTQDYKTLNMTS